MDTLQVPIEVAVPDRVETMAGLLAAPGCAHPVAPVEGQSFVFD